MSSRTFNNKITFSGCDTIDINLDLILKQPVIQQINQSITLHYKIKKMASEWNISTDSTSLGLTNIQMKTCFTPSAQIFLKNDFFQTILDVNGKISSFSPGQNVAFILLKTKGTISRFQPKKSVCNRTQYCPRY